MCLSDIEEITHKTGHFLAFDAFIRTLRAAMTATGSDDCVIDILTYADLHALKSGRRPGGQSSSSNEGPPVKNNKRYIILTQTGGRDR